MAPFHSSDRKVAIWLTAAALFAALGVAASWLAGERFMAAGNAEWQHRAYQEARRLTRNFNSTLQHVEENIRTITAFLAASEKVTQEEFLRFIDAAESWNYQVRFEALAFATCSAPPGRDRSRPCRIGISAEPGGIFARGERPDLGPEFVRATLAAIDSERRVVFSDPFEIGRQHHLLIAARATNGDRDGVVLGLVNIDRLFARFQAEIPVGLNLRVLHEGATPFVDAPAVEIYGQPWPREQVSKVFEVEDDVNRTRWAMIWEVAPRYQGGPPVQLGNLIAYGGSALALLAACVMAILILQNGVIRQRVRERTEDLARARMEAERANRAKSMFLANMSHELRTPLNAIIGFSEVMKDSVLGPIGDPRYKGYAHDINASGAHLLALVNDIIDISRIDVDRVELNREPADLAALVADSERQVERQAREKGITIGKELPARLPAVDVDPLRIRQALINVLGNAIKFSPDGGTIHLTATRTQDGGISLQISDSGPGIAETDIRKVLEPFGQVDDGLDRQHEGVGLGLPLAKRFLELHGGTLRIASRFGKGTTVTLVLPADCVLSEDGSEADAAPPASVAQGH